MNFSSPLEVVKRDDESDKSAAAPRRQRRRNPAEIGTFAWIEIHANIGTRSLNPERKEKNCCIFI